MTTYEGLATKQNPADVKSELKQENALIRKDLIIFENRIIIKIFAMLALAVAVITWLDKIVK